MDVKNILVPIDFSKCSKNALKVAIKIAKDTGSKIHMVNAVHVHTPHPDLAGGSLIDAIINDYEDQVKESFDELESEMIELNDVPHEADRFLTYFTDAVRTEAESKDIDLIVMGTRSDHEGIEHLVGTNATDIIQSSNIPVLVVPEDFPVVAPKRIGFASDFHKIIDYGPLKALKWIAKMNNAEVFVFHISEKPVTLSEEQERQIELIKEKLEGIKVSIRTVESNSAVEGIRDFIDNHKLDLLAMMPRKHNIFEKLFRQSVTKSVVVDPVIPTLTFHE